MQYPIDRNHSDMVKFEDGFEDYRRVRDSLLDLQMRTLEESKAECIEQEQCLVK